MHLRNTLLLLLTGLSMALSAQTQSWQWIKAGGSSTDNTGNNSAMCNIAGCDAKGNVYAEGAINGSNFTFDTFTSAGTYGQYFLNSLIFSYDCAGNMRWAKQIGDNSGAMNPNLPDVVTDIKGNTYYCNVFLRGFHIGDTIIDAGTPNNFFTYIIKLDSLGKIIWVSKYDDDYAATTNTGVVFGYGMRIGSSGNLWMKCFLDTGFNFGTIRATKQGFYQVEISPNTGSILGGYYCANPLLNTNFNNIGGYYDLDEHENYYETGVLTGDLGAGGDTLILSNGRYYVDTANGSFNNSFVYSLDRNGNFRFILRDTVPNALFAQLNTCRYDLQAHRLVTIMNMDPLTVYGKDTFTFNSSLLGGPGSSGVLSIDTNGKVLWGKYVTSTNSNFGFFQNVLTPQFISHRSASGYYVYNNSDTIHAGTGSCASNCTDYYRNILKIDSGGDYQATYTAHLGDINLNIYGDYIQSGATDWRGNLYMGGSITNFMALPNGDSISNTDPSSGDFFIAKIGISDCSCPSPGVQFTQTSNGDTAYFDGSTLNHSDSIHWEFGDGSMATGDTFKHVYAQNGTYTVTAIAYSGCGVDSITKQVTVRNVGISVVEPDKTNLYPNPATNAVNLEVSAASTIGLVFANGSSAWEHPVQVSQAGTYVFDMARYSPGLYYFIVSYTNGKVDVMQVVKE